MVHRGEAVRDKLARAFVVAFVRLPHSVYLAVPAMSGSVVDFPEVVSNCLPRPVVKLILGSERNARAFSVDDYAIGLPSGSFDREQDSLEMRLLLNRRRILNKRFLESAQVVLGNP